MMRWLEKFATFIVLASLASDAENSTSDGSVFEIQIGRPKIVQVMSPCSGFASGIDPTPGRSAKAEHRGQDSTSVMDDAIKIISR